MQRSPALALAALLVLSLVAVVPASAHINNVSADAQVSPDGTVVAESVFVVRDGWIAVFDDANHTEVLGYRRLEADGFQEDVTVTIDADHWAEFDERTVHVALLNDDDGEFEPNSDDSVLSAFGNEASEAVPLRKGPRALVTEEAFSPDWVNESTLTLRSVTLAEAGHVVVRNASTGEAHGSTTLEAGRHESVDVELDEESAFDGGGNYRLVATLHGDDGDGTYRASDPDVTANGTVVSTRFRVRRSAPDDGTPTDADGSGTDSTTGRAGTATGPGTPTPTESFVNTPTASPTPTAGAADSAGTPTDATAGRTDTSGDGAGFGLVAAAAGLVGAGLLARHRGGER